MPETRQKSMQFLQRDATSSQKSIFAPLNGLRFIRDTVPIFEKAIVYRLRSLGRSLAKEDQECLKSELSTVVRDGRRLTIEKLALRWRSIMEKNLSRSLEEL